MGDLYVETLFGVPPPSQTETTAIKGTPQSTHTDQQDKTEDKYRSKRDQSILHVSSYIHCVSSITAPPGELYLEYPESLYGIYLKKHPL